MTADVPTDSPSPPPVALLQMMTGYWVTQAVYVAAKLGVADLLANGPASCDDLAAATHTDAPSLHRVLRALASVGVFSQVAPGRFALTPLAALLRSGTPDSMRALAIMYAEEQYRAWGDMLYSVRTGQPAFEHQFGMGVFEYFAKNPEASAVFNEAMTGWTIRIADAVVGSYDFSTFATVVDVGGNQGTLLAAILRSHSATRGVLFDLPHVVAGAEPVLAKAGVEGRCARLGGDFFQAVPAGGDAYVLASILHDWDDSRCVAILTRCRSVMPAHGRLLIVELVLPPGDEPFLGKWLDLHMLVMASGRERTAAEYAKLLRAGGFELSRVVPTPAGPSIVEAVPASTP
jgi:O-methyltransferase/methyltransferase family protein